MDLLELMSSSEEEVESEDEQERDRNFRIRQNSDLANASAFKEKFRLRPSEVELVLEKLENGMPQRNYRHVDIDPPKRILIFLHWLSNGCQYHGIGDMHGVCKATVCNAVWKTAKSIVDTLFLDVIRFPNDFDHITQDFQDKGGFPSVCALVDGTLINIDAPNQNEEQFVDRKGKHSLNVLMMCGPDLKFYCVNAKYPGAAHDSRVLRNTTVAQKFNAGWRPFPGAVVLGDSGYAASDWLITPINRNPNDIAEQQFNRCHRQTRRLVENAYGVLKERFPCLNHLRLQPKKLP